MKDNKGFSLVELLVAMAVASIVAGSIGYFLVNSMHMYGNEINDMTMQQEVSAAFNIIEDYIKEAQFIAIGNYTDDDANGHTMTLNENKTKYLVLGTFEKAVNGKNKQNVNKYFTGVIIVSDSTVMPTAYSDGTTPVNGCLYLKKYNNLQIDKETNGDGTLKGFPSLNLSKPLNIKNEVKSILNDADKTKYLLATNVQNFNVVPDNMAPNTLTILPGQCNNETALKNGYKVWVDNDSGADLQYYYENNLSLNVTLTVARQLSGKAIKKTISESIMLRNSLSEDIIINNPDTANTDPEKVIKFKKYNNTKFQ